MEAIAALFSTVATALHPYINIQYCITVIGLSAGVLGLLFKNPSSFIKIAVALFFGILFFFIFYFWQKEQPQILFSSFTTSVVLHNWIIKRVCKMLGISYNNGKGII